MFSKQPARWLKYLRTNKRPGCSCSIIQNEMLLKLKALLRSDKVSPLAPASRLRCRARASFRLRRIRWRQVEAFASNKPGGNLAACFPYESQRSATAAVVSGFFSANEEFCERLFSVFGTPVSYAAFTSNLTAWPRCAVAMIAPALWEQRS